MRQIEKVKLELKLPLNREEIMMQFILFWEQKFAQHSQSSSQTDPKVIEQVKMKFQHLNQSFKKMDKDGYEFYKELKL